MLRLVATFWRYVRIQLIVFVFGCVGPIFLIIFFATQPDPSTKWAYWVGLFITAAEVLIALGITNASDPKKPPANSRVAKRRQSVSSDDSSSSSTVDPFPSTFFSSNDSGSSSSDYSSHDSGSSSSDYSSSDSGSSSSDSGSSSSSD
jgi:hypothetical protein